MGTMTLRTPFPQHRNHRLIGKPRIHAAPAVDALPERGADVRALKRTEAPLLLQLTEPRPTQTEPTPEFVGPYDISARLARNVVDLITVCVSLSDRVDRLERALHDATR
jgi:hypothetical protein